MTHNDAPQSWDSLWTSDQLVAETSDNTQHSQETDIHFRGGIRTRNHNRQVAARPLRPVNLPHVLFIYLGGQLLEE